MAVIERSLSSRGGALVVSVPDGDTLEVRIVGEGVAPFSVKPAAGSATVKAAVVNDLAEIDGSPLSSPSVLQDVLEAAVGFFTVAASGGSVSVEISKSN